MDTHNPCEFDIKIRKISVDENPNSDVPMWRVESAEGRRVWTSVFLGDALGLFADAVVAEAPEWAVDIKELENPPVDTDDMQLED